MSHNDHERPDHSPGAEDPAVALLLAPPAIAAPLHGATAPAAEPAVVPAPPGTSVPRPAHAPPGRFPREPLDHLDAL